jgi:hypothetical protein
VANYGLSELFIALIEGFGGPRPSSFGPGELYEALVQAVDNFAGGGIVTSYNTRTGAVTSQLSDVTSLFGAAGELFIGTGTATGGLLVGPLVNGQYLQAQSGAVGWGQVQVASTVFTSNAYTLVVGDANTAQQASNGSTAATVTIPLHASVAFPVGTVITFTQTGTGKIKLASSATIQSSISGGFVSGTTGCRAEFSSIGLLNTATDTWVLSGDVA